MTHSLRRTLALRFAGIMGAGLAALSMVILSPLGAQHPLLTHVSVLAVATSAAFVGAWLIAGSAIRPMREIAAQAALIEVGALDRRIVAPADMEFGGLVTVLNRMLERLDATIRTQRRLIADVSHELRAPLTALQGEIEVALRAPRSPEEYEIVLRSALEEVHHLARIGDDLLIVTRADSSLLVPQRVPTDVNALIRAALTPLDPGIEAKHLTLKESLDPTVGPVPLDSVLVGRLVAHLLENAVKYTPAGGLVSMSTRAGTPASQGVRIVVENSGSGIEVVDLPHIFEPFYRADQARTRGDGRGLGLTLVAAIVRAHDGSVRATNEDGNRVRFEVDLPASALAKVAPCTRGRGA